jgi:hypothetical protein
MSSLLNKRKIIAKLVSKLLEGGTSEEEDNEIFNKISNLSLNPKWSDYIYIDFDFYDKNEVFLMDKFLDKILSYEENVIMLCPVQTDTQIPPSKK